MVHRLLYLTGPKALFVNCWDPFGCRVIALCKIVMNQHVVIITTACGLWLPTSSEFDTEQHVICMMQMWSRTHGLLNQHLKC